MLSRLFQRLLLQKKFGFISIQGNVLRNWRKYKSEETLRLYCHCRIVVYGQRKGPGEAKTKTFTKCLEYPCEL